MARQPGPVPTIINVFRQAAGLMIDDLIARLDAAGFAGLTPAHSAVFENLDPGGTHPDRSPHPHRSPDGHRVI